MDEILAENDANFKKWENNQKGVDAKINGQAPPTYPHDLKVDNVFAPDSLQHSTTPQTYPYTVAAVEARVRERREQRERFDAEIRERLHVEALEAARSVVTPHAAVRHEHDHVSYYSRRYARNKKIAAVVGIILLVPVGIFWNDIFTPTQADMPRLTTYEGQFYCDSILVVDGDTAEDVSAFVSYMMLYITNNSNDWEQYYFVGNATTIPGLVSLLGGIGDEWSYNHPVVYTMPVAPYTDTWEYLDEGDNYIYLYK